MKMKYQQIFMNKQIVMKCLMPSIIRLDFDKYLFFPEHLSINQNPLQNNILLIILLFSQQLIKAARQPNHLLPIKFIFALSYLSLECSNLKIFYFMRMTMLEKIHRSVVLLSILFTLCAANYFKTPNFELFDVPLGGYRLFSNPDWYAKENISAPIQIQYFVQRLSKVMEIYSNGLYTMCQNIALPRPDVKYVLTFDYTLRWSIEVPTFITVASMNNETILNREHGFADGVLHFTVQFNNLLPTNVFCVGGTAPKGFCGASSTVDNFTLVSLSRNVSLFLIVAQKDGRIILQTNLQGQSFHYLSDFCQMTCSTYNGVNITLSSICSVDSNNKLLIVFEITPTVNRSLYEQFQYVLPDGVLADQSELLNFSSTKCIYRRVLAAAKPDDRINILVIFTQLLLPDSWKPYLDSSSYNISKDGKIIPADQAGMKLDSAGYLTFELSTTSRISKDTQIRVSLVNQYFLSDRGNLLCFDFTVETIQTFFNYSPRELKFLKIIEKIVLQILHPLNRMLALWSLVAFNLAIYDLLAITNLMAFYVLLPLDNLLNPVRSIIERIFFSTRTQATIPHIFFQLFELSVDETKMELIPQQMPSQISGKRWIGYFQFHINVLRNIWEYSLTLPLMCVKIAGLLIFSNIPIALVSKKCKHLLREAWLFFLFEIVLISPAISVVISSHLTHPVEMQVNNWKLKLNKAILIHLFLICLFSIVSLLIITLKKIFKVQEQLKKKPNFVQQKETVHPMVCMADYGMFLLIPFLIGFRSTLLFLIPMTVYHIVRLSRVIRYRKYMKRYCLIKQILNKALWMILHCLYLFVFFTDTCQQFLSSDSFRTGIKYCNYAILSTMLLGIILQVFFLLGDFLLYIKSECTRCSNIRSRLRPESEAKSQRKHMVRVNNQKNIDDRSITGNPKAISSNKSQAKGWGLVEAPVNSLANSQIIDKQNRKIFESPKANGKAKKEPGTRNAKSYMNVVYHQSEQPIHSFDLYHEA